MMKEKQFNFKEFYPKLFIDSNDLKKLDSLGHLIGLHSHNHPTLLEKLNYDEQKDEYVTCISIISRNCKAIDGNKFAKYIAYCSIRIMPITYMIIHTVVVYHVNEGSI